MESQRGETTVINKNKNSSISTPRPFNKKSISSEELPSNILTTITQYNSPTVYNRDQYIYLIYLADKCERYEDALSAFEAMIQRFQCNLTAQERETFESCFKNIIKTKQKNLNKISIYIEKLKKQQKENDTNFEENFLTSIVEEKAHISNSLKSVCKKALRLIDNYLIKYIHFLITPLNEENSQNNDKENEMFLLRLKGDIYKYLSQVDNSEDYKNLLNSANQFFKDALIIGTDNFPISNKTLLETVIAYSKFLQDFLKNKEEALKLLTSIYNSDAIESILGSGQVDENVIKCLNTIQIMTESLHNS
jgi:hypothetical protein